MFLRGSSYTVYTKRAHKNKIPSLRIIIAGNVINRFADTVLCAARVHREASSSIRRWILTKLSRKKVFTLSSRERETQKAYCIGILYTVYLQVYERSAPGPLFRLEKVVQIRRHHTKAMQFPEECSLYIQLVWPTHLNKGLRYTGSNNVY